MLPTILGFVIFALVAGFGVTYTGYYVPFMIMGSALMALGSGLLTIISPESGPAAWICYQIPIGMGGGLGVEQPYIAVMSVLDLAEVPPGVAFVSFTQALGSTMAVTVAENIFNLIRRPSQTAIAADGSGVGSSASARRLQWELDAGASESLRKLYSVAITKTFFITVATAIVSMGAALGMEWVSVKKKDEKLDEKDPV